MEIKTTIIIPNYNGLSFMEPCFESLKEQTVRDFKVLVVDNGSTDGSVEWLKEHRVPSIFLKENTGFSGAVNTGIRAADTPYVLLLNNDTRVEPGFVAAMERAMDAGLKNVFFVDGDAALLPDMFASGEVDRLYINFCDPWPKSNQKKRRLTHGNFLKQYRRGLADSGQIHFKTDNDKLFAWSVEEIPQFGFQLSEVTTDLHKDGAVGVMTDYERKFFNEGKNINRCVATMVPWEEPAEPEAPEVAAEPAE